MPVSEALVQPTHVANSFIFIHMTQQCLAWLLSSSVTCSDLVILFFFNIISYFERKKSFQFNFLQTLRLPEQFISRNHEEAFILLPFGSKYSEIMI